MRGVGGVVLKSLTIFGCRPIPSVVRGPTQTEWHAEFNPAVRASIHKIQFKFNPIQYTWFGAPTARTVRDGEPEL